MTEYDLFYGLGLILGYGFALLIYVGIPVLFGTVGYKMAGNRGRHQWGWGIACAIFPLLALLILAVIGETPEVKQRRANEAALFAQATLAQPR